MPVLPVSRRRLLAYALLLVGVLVVAGRHLVGRGTASVAPPPQAAATLERAEPARVLVHVVGAVRRPGVYALKEGSRTADAVSRAGGVTRRADVSAVNLAAPLADGTQVLVPVRAQPVPAPAAAPAAGGGGEAGQRPPGGAAPVHLNTATLEQLDALPGIGPVTAQKILAYRQQHGPFTSVDELDAVPGVGPARLEELRGLVLP